MNTLLVIPCNVCCRSRYCRKPYWIHINFRRFGCLRLTAGGKNRTTLLVLVLKLELWFFLIKEGPANVDEPLI